MSRLAIVTSHPIQYYAPWFCDIAQQADLDLKVFYLWNFGVTQQLDIGFNQSLQWDIPLLKGYDFEFVPNVSPNPGTHHLWGLQNPSLLKQVKAFRPDIVLLMCYHYASLYRFLAGWNSRQTPLLFRGDSHRLVPNSGIKSRLKQQAITQIYRRFAACLYVGKANYDYFRYHNVPHHNLFFSPHAIDNDRFFHQTDEATQGAIVWKKELGIPDTHTVILFAGKFEPKKRPLDLLTAFIMADLSQVSLLFVGAGSLESDLRAAADRHLHIHLAPFQNQSLMPRTYAIADVVVLPSYGSGETWGLVINEAMCMGKPVIVSSYVGCAQDLVEDGKNGFIFPAGNIKALSHCLAKILQHPNQLKILGNASQSKIKEYSYKQATEGLMKAINHVI